MELADSLSRSCLMEFMILLLTRAESRCRCAVTTSMKESTASSRASRAAKDSLNLSATELYKQTHLAR